MQNPPTHSSLAVFERELQQVLIRHLPVGFEGIGVAQAVAVLNLVKRRENHRPRPAVEAGHREGLRLLKQVAHTHAASATVASGGVTVCGICRTDQDTPQSWPCPVWVSAELLAVVEPATPAQVI